MHEYHRFTSALKHSGCASVDSFLEFCSDEWMDLGKVAIAAKLLPKERTSQLFDEWRGIRREPERAEAYEHNWPWYDLLIGVLCDGVRFDAVRDNSLSIITFNYDRSLEHFMFTALKNRYGKSDAECAKVLDCIRVRHVYGSLGKLEWQKGADETNTVPYDSPGETGHIQRAAKSITILHESIEDSPEFIAARELLESAEQVFFLGFGFHPVNLKRLGIHRGSILLPRETAGTAIDLVNDRRDYFDKITQPIRGGGHRNGTSVLVDCDVYTLLHDYATFS